MIQTAERNAAAELAKRIEVRLVDPGQIDEAKRPPADRPPHYADTLMSEAPASVERSADLNQADWQLISKALEHYAACRG